MRFFGKFSRGKWRPLIVSLIGFKHQPVNTAHEGGGRETTGRAKCLDDIRHLVKMYQEWNKIPGISLAISVDNNIIYNEGFGFQNKEEHIPATRNMKGDIASISKLVTAHCFIKFLLESYPSVGFHSLLGQPLRSHHPQLPTDAFYVEHRQESGRKRSLAIQANLGKTSIPLTWLFCHRAGFRATNQVKEERYNDEEVLNEVKAFQRHTEDDMFAYYPGTRVLYTGLGCALMGFIMDTKLAEISAIDLGFRGYVARELRNLQMNDTVFLSEEARRLDRIQNYARGYTFHDENSKKLAELSISPTINYSSKYPAEGLISTVLDLVNFGNYYISIYRDESDNTPFTQELIKYMWSLHSIKRIEGSRGRGDFRIQGFGLQWDIESQVYRLNESNEEDVSDKFDHRLKLRHGGYALGFSSWLQIDFIVDGNEDPTQRKPNIESALKPIEEVKNCKGCIIDEEDILDKENLLYNSDHDFFVDHTRQFGDTISNGVTWKDTFPWESYEGGHSNHAAPLNPKSSSSLDNPEEESSQQSPSKRRKFMKDFLLQEPAKENRRGKIFNEIRLQSDGIFFLPVDEDEDRVVIDEPDPNSAGPSCSCNRDRENRINPNPYITVGIIANLGQLTDMNILADRICELVRTASENGAF